MILADTDVLIDYLLGIQPVASQIRSYAESNRLRTSAISCFELLSGADLSRRGDEVRKLVATIRVLPVDLESAALAAEVRKTLSAKGFSIGMGDCLIAGTTLANGLPLFTRNRKHFQHIPELTLL